MFWDQEATGPDLMDCTAKTPSGAPSTAGEAPRALLPVSLTPAKQPRAADATSDHAMQYAEAV